MSRPKAIRFVRASETIEVSRAEFNMILRAVCNLRQSKTSDALFLRLMDVKDRILKGEGHGQDQDRIESRSSIALRPFD